MNKILYIYTDGGCHGNPGPGAWAGLLRWQGKEKELTGFDAQTTNNRMELTAVIKSLEAVSRPTTIEVYSDSQYVIKGMSDYIHTWKQDNWRVAAKKKVKNLDLWQALDAAAAPHTITWHWVRGHNGHPENEYVDDLVQKTILAHTS